MISETKLDDLNIVISDYKSTFILADYYQVYGNRGFEKRVLYTTDGHPQWADDSHYIGMNIPVYAAMSNCTMDQVYYETLMITMKDPNDYDTIDALVEDLKEAGTGGRVEAAYEEGTDTTQI